MAKVNIDDKLKTKIEDWLKDDENQWETPTLKAFINRACYYLLKLEKKKKRLSK